MPVILSLATDGSERIIVVPEDGELKAHVQKMWDGEWVTFGIASGANGEFHILTRD